MDDEMKGLIPVLGAVMAFWFGVLILVIMVS